MRASLAPDPFENQNEMLAAYELALWTLRDETLPAAAVQIAEAQRIVEQAVGPAS